MASEQGVPQEPIWEAVSLQLVFKGENLLLLEFKVTLLGSTSQAKLASPYPDQCEASQEALI